MRKTKLTKKASRFISRKIKFLEAKEHIPPKQAQAMAYSYAKRRGFKIPKKK